MRYSINYDITDNENKPFGPTFGQGWSPETPDASKQPAFAAINYPLSAPQISLPDAAAPISEIEFLATFDYTEVYKTLGLSLGLDASYGVLGPKMNIDATLKIRNTLRHNAKSLYIVISSIRDFGIAKVNDTNRERLKPIAEIAYNTAVTSKNSKHFTDPYGTESFNEARLQSRRHIIISFNVANDEEERSLDFDTTFRTESQAGHLEIKGNINSFVQQKFQRGQFKYSFKQAGGLEVSGADYLKVLEELEKGTINFTSAVLQIGGISQQQIAQDDVKTARIVALSGDKMSKTLGLEDENPFSYQNLENGLINKVINEIIDVEDMLQRLTSISRFTYERERAHFIQYRKDLLSLLKPLVEKREAQDQQSLINEVEKVPNEDKLERLEKKYKDEKLFTLSSNGRVYPEEGCPLNFPPNFYGIWQLLVVEANSVKYYTMDDGIRAVDCIVELDKKKIADDKDLRFEIAANGWPRLCQKGDPEARVPHSDYFDILELNNYGIILSHADDKNNIIDWKLAPNGSKGSDLQLINNDQLPDNGKIRITVRLVPDKPDWVFREDVKTARLLYRADLKLERKLGFIAKEKFYE